MLNFALSLKLLKRRDRFSGNLIDISKFDVVADAKLDVIQSKSLKALVYAVLDSFRTEIELRRTITTYLCGNDKLGTINTFQSGSKDTFALCNAVEGTCVEIVDSILTKREMRTEKAIR